MNRLRHILFVLVWLMIAAGCSDGAGVSDLKTERMESPVGIDVAIPRFSWRADKIQMAYRVVVAGSLHDMAKGAYLFDSGRVDSSESEDIEYRGVPLEPCTRYYWKVSVWDSEDRKTESGTAFFETGLLGRGFSKACWMGSSRMKLSRYRKDYLIDYDFTLGKSGSVSSFVFGAKDRMNYVQLSFDFSGQPEMILSFVERGVNSEIARKQLPSDVATSGVHHVSLDVKGSDGYDIRVSMDGRDISSDRYFHCPAENAYLYDIGFCQKPGQPVEFANITVSDNNWGRLLYSNSDRFEISGEGELTLLSLAEECSAPMLRRTINVKDKLESARLYACTRGIYEFYVNGSKVGDGWFNPSGTADGGQLLYDTYDITGMLKTGKNGLGVMLGNGLAEGEDHRSFLAMIVLKYRNGTSETVISDENWKCFDRGPVLENRLNRGEDYDARKSVTDWTSPDFDDSSWGNAALAGYPSDSIGFKGNTGLPVLVTNVVKAESVSRSGSGFEYDFGQEITGVEHLLEMRGRSGDRIEIRFPGAETDHYIFRGDSQGESWNPSFTVHTFRSFTIEGLEEPLALEKVEALVLDIN